MRWIPVALFSAALTASTWASDASFVRIWPRWQDAESFDRIGQYFGREEHEQSDIIVRTHPDQRAGLYFLVRVKSGAAIQDAKFVLEVIRPDAPKPKQFVFPISIPSNHRVVELGLTGADWSQGREVHPVAWKLTLLDAEGRVLATGKSFLWEKPPQ